MRKMPTKSNNTGGRGGARPGAGRKKSAVKEKAENGNPGGRKLEAVSYTHLRMSLQAVCDQMGRTPPWANGLQLRADGYETEFYKKD